MVTLLILFKTSIIEGFVPKLLGGSVYTKIKSTRYKAGSLSLLDRHCNGGEGGTTANNQLFLLISYLIIPRYQYYMHV